VYETEISMNNKAFLMGYNTLGLRFVANDIELMQQALKIHNFELKVPEQNKAVQQTKADVILQLDEFIDSCSYTDTVIIYFSGHAYAPKGELLLLLSDDLHKPNTSSIKFSYLISAIENCSARNKLLIFDCCHALSEIYDWRPPHSESYKILAASGRLEKAKEFKTYQASFLTYQLFLALTEFYGDLAQNTTGLSVSQLFNWILLQSKKHNSENIELVPLPKLIGDQGVDFELCPLIEGYLPASLKVYLTQIVHCFSECKKECFGRYPWCRITFELGYTNQYYVKPRIRYSGNNKNISESRFDKFILSWSMNELESHLAILGDSGIGKSSACLYLTLTQAIQCLQENSADLIPIFLSLDNLARQNLVSADINTILREILHINVDNEVIDRFVRERRFLFILDGFDEIADRADHARIVRNLRNLEPFLKSKCKTILTCRTHFFVDQQQVEQLLIGGSNVGTELYALLKEEHPNFKIIELQEFSEAEIKELIGKRVDDRKTEEVWESIKGLYNLEDLSRRPILLTLILQTLPYLIKNKNTTKLNRAEIYKTYVEYWLNREAKRVETDIDIKRKMNFTEHIAVEMWKKDIVSINYEELQDKIRNKYKNEIISASDFYIRDYDTRNASFLNRDIDGFYKFMHKSFMEYFVAKNLLRVLNAKKKGMGCWAIKWFDKEVANFLSEIIQQNDDLNKIEALMSLSLDSSMKQTVLWNVLHILSLLDVDFFYFHQGKEILYKIIQKAEQEKNAVILRQYCRIVAKFGERIKAYKLINRIIDIVRNDSTQNLENNNTYINYYYGSSSACEALINHISSVLPKYDRSLHIYVLGEIGDEAYLSRMQNIVNTGWTNKEHLILANEAIQKIRTRRKEGEKNE